MLGARVVLRDEAPEKSGMNMVTPCRATPGSRNWSYRLRLRSSKRGPWTGVAYAAQGPAAGMCGAVQHRDEGVSAAGPSPEQRLRKGQPRGKGWEEVVSMRYGLDWEARASPSRLHRLPGLYTLVQVFTASGRGVCSLSPTPSTRLSSGLPRQLVDINYPPTLSRTSRTQVSSRPIQPRVDSRLCFLPAFMTKVGTGPALFPPVIGVAPPHRCRRRLLISGSVSLISRYFAAIDMQNCLQLLNQG
ncbi:hypothetical protein B0H13DRAFT_1881109 [Mycena leptocephala]|nr:hypothetical protein B0H13DRAFT_1881109 [Mycena leptocephala]